MRAEMAAILLACVAVVMTSRAHAQDPGQTHYPRLRRPDRFDNNEQISNYLKELQDYYMVHGRGRFGKRQMHITDASVIFRESPIFEQKLNEEPLWKQIVNNNI